MVLMGMQQRESFMHIAPTMMIEDFVPARARRRLATLIGRRTDFDILLLEAIGAGGF